MASYKTGPFGRRMPTPPPEDVTVQEIFPPSREERMQTMWMYGTVVVAVVVLGLGLALRYTLFADMFKPQRYTPPPGAVASPEAPSANASPISEPVGPVTIPTPKKKTPVVESTPTPIPSPIVESTPAPAATPFVENTPAPIAAPLEKTPDGEPVTPSLAETGGRPVTPH